MLHPLCRPRREGGVTDLHFVQVPFEVLVGVEVSADGRLPPA